MDLRLTDIFFKNLDAYTAGENLIINQGSTGSSKTWSILQLLAFIARQAEEPLVISVVSYALPHLKMGAIRDFDRILLDMGYNPGDICNKSEYTYRLGRSTIEFFGIEGNLAKVHGPRRDFLYINEANKKITYDIFDQMHTRTRKCTIMDFNPTAEFWVHTEVMPNFPHAYIHSTWRDNTYLSDIERQKILNKYDKPGFENWVRVYGEGEIGILEGQIFTNWTVGEFDSTLPYGFGLDFGYHPDPDAMVRVAVDERRRKIYMDECFYNTGQSTDDLRKAVLRAVPSATSLIIADCADPRTITDLRKKDGPARLGLNVMPVKKDGTVSEWLKKMQGYELVITETSYNLQKEINNYVWSDTKAGIPIDAFNHLIDAGRYFFMWTKQKINTNVWA
jgi:phage terminase large subunit